MISDGPPLPEPPAAPKAQPDFRGTHERPANQLRSSGLTLEPQLSGDLAIYRSTPRDLV